MQPLAAWANWWDRRRRRLATAWRARVAAAPRPPRGCVALFCDCDGHFAGPEADRHADTGLNRLLDILDRRRLRLTFNVVAHLCRSHPARIRRILSAGHELACHGWRHERPRDLRPDAVAGMLSSALACFEALGVRPRGFRSPESAWSITLVRLLPAHGFTWNAERDAARLPYRLTPRLLRLPIATDDWDLVDGTSDEARLIQHWTALVERAACARHVLAIGVHEWTFGLRPAFAPALDAFLAHLTQRADLTICSLHDLSD